MNIIKKLYNDPVAQRIFRGAVALGVPLALQYVASSTNPTVLFLAPLINGIGKWIRDNKKWSNVPI